MTQADLFLHGRTFDSGVQLTQADNVRLGAQLRRVLDVMSDGQWWSVPELQAAIVARFGVSDPEPSISAQIRNAKKVKHGAHDVRRIRVGNVFKFRLVTR
jgi:hypothetical protein